jgi:predicted  nucleic acid-binding Zn-ribbon protein
MACGGVAQAQSLEDRLRSQLVSTVTQLRALQASQADLAAQKDAAEKANAPLKAQVSKLQAELAAARRAPRPAAVRVVAAPQSDVDKTRLAELQQAHAQDQAELTAARADRSRLDQSSAGLKADHDRLTARLTADETGLAACRSKNLQAIAVAKEILAAYDQITFGRVIARKEPFTGLERVKIQDLSQDYGDRIYHSRLDVTPRAAPLAVRPLATAPTPPSNPQ